MVIEFFFILAASILLSYFFAVVCFESIREKRNFEEQNNLGLKWKEYLEREWAKLLSLFDRLILISRKNYEDAKQSRINLENRFVANGVLKSFTPISQRSANSYDVELLKKIPGIGNSLANKLLEKFHTIEVIQNAKIDSILEINGIGKTLAEKLIKPFHNDN